jgi:hypothetical protein
MSEVTRTERGWAGHFIGARECLFRRNTLLECGNKRIVVSTVGSYMPPSAKRPDTIGYQRYYETMAFPAYFEDPYWEADTSAGELSFDSPWSIDHIDGKSDSEANAMHEAVVEEFTAKMRDEVA